MKKLVSFLIIELACAFCRHLDKHMEGQQTEQHCLRPQTQGWKPGLKFRRVSLQSLLCRCDTCAHVHLYPRHTGPTPHMCSCVHTHPLFWNFLSRRARGSCAPCALRMFMSSQGPATWQGCLRTSSLGAQQPCTSSRQLSGCRGPTEAKRRLQLCPPSSL